MDDAQQVFQPGIDLLGTIQDEQAQRIRQRGQETRRAHEESVGDIAQRHQQRGVDFDFTEGGRQRMFGAGAEPALASMEAVGDDTILQLADAITNLQASRREQGLAMDDSQRERRQERDLTQQELSQEESLQRQRLDTDLEAAQIREARRQAEAAEEARQQQSSAMRDRFEGMLADRAGEDGNVSPTTFHAMRDTWAEMGGDPQEFNSWFGPTFVNQSHEADYYGSGLEDMRRENRTQEAHQRHQQVQGDLDSRRDWLYRPLSAVDRANTAIGQTVQERAPLASAPTAGQWLLDAISGRDGGGGR